MFDLTQRMSRTNRKINENRLYHCPTLLMEVALTPSIFSLPITNSFVDWHPASTLILVTLSPVWYKDCISEGVVDGEVDGMERSGKNYYFGNERGMGILGMKQFLWKECRNPFQI